MGGTFDASNLPGAIQDAWAVLAEKSGETVKAPTASLPSSSLLDASKKDPAEFPLGRGQVGKAMHTSALSACLHRASYLSQKVGSIRSPPVYQKAKTYRAASETLLAVFDDRLQQLRRYHARHSHEEDESTSMATQGRKRLKVGHPVADGYDLGSLVSSELDQRETAYNAEEVMGKYVDLQNLPSLWRGVLPADMLEFLQLLSKGLATGIDESVKLRDRKKYSRFLVSLQSYLEGFLRRSSPLLQVKDVIQPAVREFESTWRKTGGVHGWESKPSEASWVKDSSDQQQPDEGVDLTRYETAEALLEGVGGDGLKTHLSRLGLKCGGTPLDRAKRLFLTKTTPLDKLPKKMFAKKKTTNNGSNSGGSNNANGTMVGERRVDLAKQEVVVMSLLNQLRPTLERTIRRCERRQTQTLQEREKELEEDLHGSDLATDSTKTKNPNDDDDEEDEEDTPIYNPKGVPLGWDGKPIPYWLFKLHGLNHFYPCEICGNESYRGRHNFEKHFAEAKHAYGMKCLGIPNTKHFHGVTKIEDAQELWKKLQKTLERERFDGTTEEEYEDSHGNVLSRATYEDLARQGLL